MVQAYKKRKFEANIFFNKHPEIGDNKLSTTFDTSNMEDKSGTWFWKKSANESGSNTKERENDDKNESDLELDESRAVSLEVLKKEIKWNKEG